MSSETKLSERSQGNARNRPLEKRRQPLLTGSAGVSHGEGRVHELRWADVIEKKGRDTRGPGATGQSSRTASVPLGPQEDRGEGGGRRM